MFTVINEAERDKNYIRTVEAANVPGGALVNVIVQQKAPDNVWTVTSSMGFVPNATLVQDVDTEAFDLVDLRPAPAAPEEKTGKAKA